MPVTFRNFAQCARVAAVALPLLASTVAVAGETVYFRIGTGGAGGTYFPLGQAIAEAISGVGKDGRCVASGACVRDLVAVAQMSNGSVANIEGVRAGRIEAGIAQADVAHWLSRGAEAFADRESFPGLRAIANLYKESVHVVVRHGAGIESVADLAGKRVSLDEPGSGTLVDARLILSAFELDEEDLVTEYLKPTLAAQRMREGRLDAFFIVVGHPASSVAGTVAEGVGTLIPVAGEPVERLIAEGPFFQRALIPAGIYDGVGDVETLAVGAQLLTSAGASTDLIYAVTRALWHPDTLAAIRAGHPKGREIALETALDGFSVAIHEGAVRYYREIGLIR